MTDMPKGLRKRQAGGERARFVWAFHQCLRKNPHKAPSPTAINTVLENPPPLNVLAGRLSVLRRQLLEDNGFTQANGKFSRWEKR